MAAAYPALSSMKIFVIGAGMGGLSTALALSRKGFTDITVYELASHLAELGAGINITPNFSRLLDRFGVLQDVKKECVPLESATILKGTTDETLSTVNFGYMEREFGYPYFVAHRADLQHALIAGCERSGVVKIKLGTTITSIDLDNTRVKIRPSKQVEGVEEWVQGDLIIAADGVKSIIRAKILEKQGIEDDVEDTGQASYRILLRRNQVLEHPDLLQLFDSSRTNRWIGEKRLIMSYPIAAHSIFNIVSAHPDTNFAASPSTSWTTRGSKEKMLQVFSDFCPRVHKLLSLVPPGDVCEWKLRVHRPLPTWFYRCTALLGDACHPSLPHLAQGAAQAVEDAAVLAIVLSKITSKDDIPKALAMYERLRKPRAEDCVAQAEANGRKLHLGEGAEQRERDRQFHAANKDGGANPDKAVDKETQQLLYAHDCELDALQRWDALWAGNI